MKYETLAAYDPSKKARDAAIHEAIARKEKLVLAKSGVSYDMIDEVRELMPRMYKKGGLSRLAKEISKLRG
jgi:hypothetical protein